jgi:hypothetical protein
VPTSAGKAATKQANRLSWPGASPAFATALQFLHFTRPTYVAKLVSFKFFLPADE